MPVMYRFRGVPTQGECWSRFAPDTAIAGIGTAVAGRRGRRSPTGVYPANVLTPPGLERTITDIAYFASRDNRTTMPTTPAQDRSPGPGQQASFLFDEPAGDEAGTAGLGLPWGMEHADSVLTWRREPATAFLHWCRARRTSRTEYAGHSIEQYVSMFGRFLQWRAGQLQRLAVGDERAASVPLHLELVRPQDIEAFLNGLRGGRKGDKPCAPSTRRRYLFLLHNTFEHMAEIGALEDNPCAGLPELRPNKDYERRAPAILAPAAEQRYIDWCLAQDCSRWEHARDMALRLVFLASGITVAEAQRLRVEQVEFDAPRAANTGGDDAVDVDDLVPAATLTIVAHGFVPERRAPVARFAVPALANWLRVRMMTRVAGGALFNSRRPQPEGDAATPEAIERAWWPSPEPLGKSEIYDTVAPAMRAAGYIAPRAGPQTLRNTFAARQIRAQVPPARIRDWMGLRTTDQLAIIARQVPLRSDGVQPY